MEENQAAHDRQGVDGCVYRVRGEEMCMRPMPERENARQGAQDAAWGAFRPEYVKVCAEREIGAQDAPETAIG